MKNHQYIAIYRRYIHDIFKISNPLTFLPNNPTLEMLPADDPTVEISLFFKSTLIVGIVNFFWEIMIFFLGNDQSVWKISTPLISRVKLKAP